MERGKWKGESIFDFCPFLLYNLPKDGANWSHAPFLAPRQRLPVATNVPRANVQRSTGSGSDRGDRDKVGPAPRRPKPNGALPPTGTRVAGYRETCWQMANSRWHAAISPPITLQRSAIGAIGQLRADCDEGYWVHARSGIPHAPAPVPGRVSAAGKKPSHKPPKTIQSKPPVRGNRFLCDCPGPSDFPPF